MRSDREKTRAETAEVCAQSAKSITSERLGCRNSRTGLCLSLLSIIALGQACSTEGFEPPEVLSQALESCDGTLVQSTPFEYSHVGEVVTAIGCIRRGGQLEISHFDSEGRAVDTEEMLRLDLKDFREVRDRLHPVLERRLMEATRHELEARIPAEIWFAVEGYERPLLPEEAVADAEYRREAEGLLSSAIRTARKELTGELRRIAGLEVVEDPAFRIEDSIQSLTPRVEVKGSESALREAGRLPSVVTVMYSSELEALESKPATEVYYDLAEAPFMHVLGYDGTGIEVAILESDRFDTTTYLPVAAGSCQPTGSGGWYACACPGQFAGSHSRTVAGVVANTVSTLRGGIGRGATLSSANFSGCGFANAINWARGRGVTVINRSEAGFPAPEEQPALDIFEDYASTLYPYPTFAVSSGNGGLGNTVGHLLRNGLVVGGANDLGNPSRAALTNMAWFSQDGNPTSGTTLPPHQRWEVPHIVAPAVNIDTAGGSSTPVETPSGTSWAAPQVAGVVAVLHQLNPILRWSPAATVSAVLVGPERNVDGAWPLSFTDAVDDSDGVGSVNGGMSLFAGASWRWQGLPASLWGVHGQWVDEIFNPAGYWIGSYYNAQAGANEWLRVAAVIQSRPLCTNPNDHNSCTANPFPQFLLALFSSSDVPLAWSWHTQQNYNYLAYHNTSGSVQNYRIRIGVTNWNGVYGSQMGISWLSSLQ
jgi:hypothetical protein